jgi:hypothetical protein
MTENIVTKSEFARILNKKPSYVTHLGKYGRLVYDETGKKIVVDASLKLIEESRDLSKGGVVERHEKARAEKTSDIESDDDDVEPQSSHDNSTDIVEGSYNDYKTQHEKFKALRAKQEYEQSTGLLLIAEDVLRAITNAASIIRNRFESQPDILAEQLAAESDATRIKSMMRDYNESFLTELSQLFKKLGSPCT